MESLQMGSKIGQSKWGQVNPKWHKMANRLAKWGQSAKWGHKWGQNGKWGQANEQMEQIFKMGKWVKSYGQMGSSYGQMGSNLYS
jgi:hypothetical protein